jgi:cytochrome P450
MIDLSDADYWRDPYPILQRERAAGPTTRTGQGELVLLRAEDVEFLHGDRHFSTMGLLDLERIGIHDGPFYEWRARTLNVMNGMDHERLRGYVSRAFFPKQINRLRSLVRERANTLIDAAIEAGEMDFLEGFAEDLPLWTMCLFLGIDDTDRLSIGSSLTGTEEGFTQKMTPEIRGRVEASIVALNDYVTELIARRAREPKDDIVSVLAQLRAAGEGPNEDEMHALIVNVIGGSVGSTSSALSNSLLLFAEHPDQADILRARPELARAAVEECLRFRPPFRIARRRVIEPINAFGIDLEPADTVFVPRQAANRDPERWSDPDRFDIQRAEKRHLSFGYGAHFCLGAAIARANLQEALPIVLDRLRDIEVVGKPERIPFTMDEKLDSLHIRFRPARPGGMVT